MFRPIPAIIRFSSERVLVFIRFMRLCNDGEISSSVVLIIINIKRRGWGGGVFCNVGIVLTWGAETCSCYHPLINIIRNLSQYLTNLMHKICFTISFISCLYLFRALCAHHQEVKIALHSLWYHHTCRWPSRAQVCTS